MNHRGNFLSHETRRHAEHLSRLEVLSSESGQLDIAAEVVDLG